MCGPLPLQRHLTAPHLHRPTTTSRLDGVKPILPHLVVEAAAITVTDQIETENPQEVGVVEIEVDMAGSEIRRLVYPAGLRSPTRRLTRRAEATRHPETVVLPPNAKRLVLVVHQEVVMVVLQIIKALMNEIVE